MPRMKRISLFSLVLLLTTVTMLHAEDRFSGEWKLNLAKSTYSPGKPPKSQVTTLYAVKGGIREVVDRVNADGSKTHWDYTAKFDGKDYKIKGDPDRDSASIKQIDGFTLEIVNKKDGKVTTSMKLVVAANGMSRTNTVTGTNAAGAAIHNVLVFDKTGILN